MKSKVYEGGYLPTRAHFDDGGSDLRTPEAFTLAPAGQEGDSYVVDLKIAVEIPIGQYGKLESKSGLNVNHSVVCTGGIIDSGFRGTIKVRMMNQGHEPYHFERGDKVCQIIVHDCLLNTWEDVGDGELDPSDSGRNKSGWGSTGRK